MRGAPELKLIVALADAQLGSAGRVGAGVKRAEPDLDTAERCCRVSLRDLDGELVLGFCRRRDAEPRRQRVVSGLTGSGMKRTAYSANCWAGAGTSSAAQYSASVPGHGASPSVPDATTVPPQSLTSTRPARARPDADFAPTLIANVSPATTGIGTSQTARLIAFRS